MRTRHLLSLWALVTLATADESWSNCPAVCKCKWASGRKVAGCNNASLTTIPANLSSQIQSIDLSHNALHLLPADAFRSVGLVNLHKLFLRSCGIRSVDRRAFAGLEILIELDLSWNAVQVLHPVTFRDNVRLRQVYVNHNPLQKLQDGIFNDMVFLQTVDASDCELTHVGEKAFVGVPKLHDLKLNNNNLTNIKLAAVEHVRSLVSLVLFGNPWVCNCDLKFFIDWALYRNLYTPPTMCQEPASLRGKLWSELTAEDLACRPQISVPAPVVEASEDNVTLRCQSSGSPTPEMHWVFNSRIITNDSGRHVLRESLGSVRWLNLTVVGVGVQDAGDYMCVVKSPGGMEERSVFLKVLEGPERRAGVKETGYASETWSLIIGVVAGSFILFATASTFAFYFFCRKGCRANNRQDGTSPVKRAACCESSGNAEKLPLPPSPAQKPATKLETSLIADDECSGVDVVEENIAGDSTDSLNPQERAISREELFVTMTVADCRAYPPDLVPYPKRVAPATPNSSTWVGRRAHGAMSCSRSQTQFPQRHPLTADSSRWTGWGSADRLTVYDNLGPRATVDGSAAPSTCPLGVTDVGSQTCQPPAESPICHAAGGLPSHQSSSGLSNCQAHGGVQAYQLPSGLPDCQARGGVPTYQSPSVLPDCQAHGGVQAYQSRSGLPDCQTHGGVPTYQSPSGLPDCQAHGGVPTYQSPSGLPDCQARGGVPTYQSPSRLPDCQAHGGFPTCQALGGFPSCQVHNGAPSCQPPGGWQNCQAHSGVPSCLASGGHPSCQSAAVLSGCQTHGGVATCQALGGLPSCQVHSGVQSCQTQLGWQNWMARGAAPTCQSPAGAPACQSPGRPQNSQKQTGASNCKSAGGLPDCQPHSGRAHACVPQVDQQVYVS